jgi:orotate phosphoribosyltransferase-like protein
MSVEVLHTIKQQVVTLSLPEKEQLAEFLAEQLRRDAQGHNGQAISPHNEELRQQRMAWLKANQAEYGGQYVALAGDQLISTGRTLREAIESARAAGHHNVFATYLAKPDEVAEWGGWA